MGFETRVREERRGVDKDRGVGRRIVVAGGPSSTGTGGTSATSLITVVRPCFSVLECNLEPSAVVVAGEESEDVRVDEVSGTA